LVTRGSTVNLQAIEQPLGDPIVDAANFEYPDGDEAPRDRAFEQMPHVATVSGLRDREAVCALEEGELGSPDYLLVRMELVEDRADDAVTLFRLADP
jgi:hypothetical protein